jgi:hypothetical protein
VSNRFLHGRKYRHHVHAGMSYRSISEVMVSVQSQAKIYASHAVKYPGSKSSSSVKRFREALMGHLAVGLLVVVVEPSLDTRA